jgi:endoplasmic reticulum resident protein 44
VNKYPTLKLFRHGLMIKREYRGARQVDAMFDYLQKQIQSPIIKILPENVDSKKSSIIGYFLDENSSNFQIFSKVANLLRDECEFIQLINSDQRTDFISYHSSNGKNIPYNGLLNNEESLYIWSNKNCIPLIKEITF